MRRLSSLPPGRLITLTGAVLFAVFFVVAFLVRNAGVGSEDTLSMIAGLLAYAFIAFAAVVAFRAWRRRPQAAERAIHSYLSTHPAVLSWLGTPLEVRVPGDLEARDVPGQTNAVVDVEGPLGAAQADLVLARLGREWEVLQAVLVLDGERVKLTKTGP
jgi:hypothetical protein